MVRRFFVVACSIAFLSISSYQCQGEDLFLRSKGGFQIHIESDWAIDPLEAYEQATASLGDKLKISGVSYQSLNTINRLNEELATKDLAYGKVYRMKLTGFVSDDDIAKARSELKRQFAQTQIRILSAISIFIASTALFAFAFIKADRMSGGDKRIAVGFFCTAWFLVLTPFAIGTIW